MPPIERKATRRAFMTILPGFSIVASGFGFDAQGVPVECVVECLTSDPAVAIVEPIGENKFEVTAKAQGVVYITARFKHNPKSGYRRLRIVVGGEDNAAA
jgi:hypothetical protein